MERLVRGGGVYMSISWRAAVATAPLVFAGFAVFPTPAGAAVHEITAAYCSGGGHGTFDGNAIEPPGVATPGATAFAKPVISSGAITVPELLTTDAPQVKVQAGLFAPTFELNASTIDHPSEHCNALQP